MLINPTYLTYNKFFSFLNVAKNIYDKWKIQKIKIKTISSKAKYYS